MRINFIYTKSLNLSGLCTSRFDRVLFGVVSLVSLDTLGEDFFDNKEAGDDPEDDSFGVLTGLGEIWRF